MLLRLTFLLLAAVLFATCDKDIASECTGFRSALVANDKEKILKMVNQEITRSFLLVTSRQNLEALSNHFKNDCNLEVKYVCFECIDTNPPMSEISVQFLNGATLEVRTIDLWHDPQENKMKAINVH
jgi:hypothetical protein